MNISWLSPVKILEWWCYCWCSVPFVRFCWLDLWAPYMVFEHWQILSFTWKHSERQSKVTPFLPAPLRFPEKTPLILNTSHLKKRLLRNNAIRVKVYTFVIYELTTLRAFVVELYNESVTWRVVKSQVAGPILWVSDPVGLGWDEECTFLRHSRGILMLLIWGPHFENCALRISCLKEKTD